MRHGFLLVLQAFFFNLPFILLANGDLRARGLVLPLYASDPDFDYGFALDEIADTGANAVSLVIVLLQENANSTEIYSKQRRTVSEDTLRKTIRQARANNLQVMLLPIVLLESPGADDWRGSLEPDSLEEWFLNYGKWIMLYADIAREENVGALSIGSEFSSLEKHAKEWKELIARVRQRFDGTLLYSCNWDHLDGPSDWWKDLDVVGLSSYYELTQENDASQEVLNRAWMEEKEELLRWREQTVRGMPIVFTEIGYPSIDGAAVYPWDYTRKEAMDLNEQKRCYQAFINAWNDEERVGGVYFYKWLSFEGNDEKSYSPRGKPAELLLRAWFEAKEKDLSEAADGSL